MKIEFHTVFLLLHLQGVWKSLLRRTSGESGGAARCGHAGPVRWSRLGFGSARPRRRSTAARLSIRRAGAPGLPRPRSETTRSVFVSWCGVARASQLFQQAGGLTGCWLFDSLLRACDPPGRHSHPRPRSRHDAFSGPPPTRNARHRGTFFPQEFYQQTRGIQNKSNLIFLPVVENTWLTNLVDYVREHRNSVPP